MRNVLLVIVALALWLNWDRIDRFFDGEPAVTGASTNGDVVLYATAWCGYCRKTRDLLRDKGVAFREFDIEKSEEGLAQFEALGGKGVPVLKVRDTVIHGYDEARIRAALD